MFGVPLNIVVARERSMGRTSDIPSLVENLVEYIRKNGKLESD